MSITEIARAAGVSKSTVSRVLNQPGYKCSDPKLQDRIWKVAMEQNYVPNKAARSLRQKGQERSDRIFSVNILVMAENQADSFYSGLISVLKSKIHDNNCILSKMWYYPAFADEKRDRFLQSMQEDTGEKGDGLIIVGNCNRDILQKLKRQYRGMVSVNRECSHCGIDEVTGNGKAAVRQAIKYLAELGHRQIAYIGACREEVRFTAYKEILAGQTATLGNDLIFEAEITESGGFAAMERLLQTNKYPTAIFCSHDTIAVGALRCLAKYKKHYYDPSVISCDGIEEAQQTRPMLTTVELPREEIGSFAVWLLMDSLKGKHKGSTKIEVESRLVKRESCHPAGESMRCEYYI